jgi:hypothetical protein
MRLLTLCWVLLLGASAAAQQPQVPDVWEPYRFLLGAWTAEGHGQPGQGKGSFSFGFELQGKILVRRNSLQFPATPQRPAFAHDDLLVIYREGDATPSRAVYFDSEGFVIHYAVVFSDNGKMLSFVSEPMPKAPRQRLTYLQNADGTLYVKFELAPADKPDAFVTHVEGVARRVEKGAAIGH